MARALQITITATLAALALTACGATKRPAARSKSATAQYAASRCMRSHGVPNFPDPRADGGNSVAVTPGSATITIAGIAFSGPAFTAAEKRCDPLGLGQPRPAVSAAQKRQLIAFARCMRTHGLRQWADPRFPPSGGIEQGDGPYSRDDPRVQAAAKACNGRR